MNISYSYAQEGFMLGVGPTLTSENSLLGTNARVYYGTSPKFCFGPEISIFPYQKTTDEVEERLFEANLNAHYLFEFAHRFEVYPLTGVNYTIENERSATDLEEEEHSAAGINFGLGLHYSFGQVLVFSEFKSVVGELNDEFFTLGAVFMLKKSGATENHGD
nr:hypothetical protein [Allomuricauda sp.]